MKLYWVEGVYQLKKKRGIEPLAKAVWAEDPADAVRIAIESLGPLEWREGPTVSLKTEEDRMRQIGAPLLPGFGSPAKPAKGGGKPAASKPGGGKPAESGKGGGKPAPAKPARGKPAPKKPGRSRG